MKTGNTTMKAQMCGKQTYDKSHKKSVVVLAGVAIFGDALPELLVLIERLQAI